MDVTPLRIALESPDPGTDKNINILQLSRLFSGVHEENELDIFYNSFRLWSKISARGVPQTVSKLL